MAKARGLYLTPYDHAFASGPVSRAPPRPKPRASKFDREDDAELLWRIFEAFESFAVSGERLRLSLKARVVSKNREKRHRSATIARSAARSAASRAGAYDRKHRLYRRRRDHQRAEPHRDRGRDAYRSRCARVRQ